MGSQENVETGCTPIISRDNSANEQGRHVPATQIRRSPYVVLLVLFYAALVLFAWIVTCRLSYRPITANHYGAWIWEDSNNGWGWTNTDYVVEAYRRNERWYRAARVVQSIASVLTIPLTSAMMVLADKGWTDVGTYFRLASRHGSRYISSFLVWAVLLHIIGGIISPLQQIFLSTVTIKTPTYPMEVGYLLDIPDKFQESAIESSGEDATVAMARAYLASTSGNDFPSQLWAKSVNCTPTEEVSFEKAELCSIGGTSWGNLSILADPFLAQLPKDYNTGLVQQFMPRFNSTAQYTNISAADFPTNCDTTAGALSIRQSNTPINVTDEVLSWAVHACMPADLRVSPRTNTRARQNFTEELYLNVSLSEALRSEIEDGDTFMPVSQYFRITVDTTAGYFELPNYMSGQTAGPLLQDDPSSECGNSCEAQGSASTSYDIAYDFPSDPFPTKRHTKYTKPSIEPLELIRNKGPLLTTALALFGPNSWLDLVNRYSDLYEHHNLTNSTICIDTAPLSRILNLNTLTTTNPSSSLFQINPINTCINPTSPNPTQNQPEGLTNTLLASSWLYNFLTPTASNDPTHIYTLRNDTTSTTGTAYLSNAFTIAAYLSHMAWISEGNSISNTLTVAFDMGADSQKPATSRTGMVLVSVLIGVDLVGLVGTAAYASWFPRWTGALDAFSLLRMGGKLG
ncbi:hypothetical protein BO94DRAFT_622225 [Aspergillus sclerotioniger CBS 115572]|uniref:Uncharacterized protein n=1 Tax=Aspergillus sclerotioniger CBS 115572 TaxID=1450535 RepID=A0A317X631_9EURO|nr:hypothetical protein BO94DRAFT_622225 [Aspergillus sclerotioniger CBS 115572]PWY93017.1 hypothetical protein BO94DRAFT_622225 [Aspergillus sclerotioniger CBS 115572]